MARTSNAVQRTSDLNLGALAASAVLVLLTTFLSASPGAAAWVSVGPEAAVVFCLAGTADDPAVVFAGTGNGLYRSRNAGGTWVPLGPVQTTIRSIAVHRSNPKLVFAGCSNNASGLVQVLRSPDSGRSWEPITTQPISGNRWFGSVNDIAVDPTDERRVFIATDRGLFMTSDGGRSWTSGPATDPGYAVLRVAIDPSNAAVLYALTYPAAYRSADGGLTWTALNLAPWQESSFLQDLVIDPAEPRTLYIGHNAGVIKSSDSGATWVDASAGLSPDRGVTRLAINPTHPNTLYGAGWGEVWTSSDAGGHWSLLPHDWGRSGRVQALLVEPGEPATVYAGLDGQGVTKTIDGGASWSLVLQGLGNVYVTTLFVDADGRSFAGTELQGIFRSDDGGTSWGFAADGLPYASCLEEGPCFVVNSFSVGGAGSARVYAATSHGAFVSRDGGDSWTRLSVPGNVFAVSEDPAAADVFVVGSTNAGMVRGGLFRSTDGGTTWSQPAAALGVIRVYALVRDPFDPQVLLAGVMTYLNDEATGRLLRSSDGGATWSEFGEFPGIPGRLAADTRSRGLVYAAGGGGVLRSTDGGRSWFDARQGLPCTLYDGNTYCSEIHALALDSRFPGTIYAATSAGLYVSTDGAVSWQRLALPEGAGDVRAVATLPDPRGILVGTFGDGVLRFEPDPPRVRRHLGSGPAEPRSEVRSEVAIR